MESCDLLTCILHGCFSGMMSACHSTHEVTLEDKGQMDWFKTTTKYKQRRTCMHDSMDILQKVCVGKLGRLF